VTREQLEHVIRAACDVAGDNIGELSRFHQTYEIYAHGLPVDAPTLPSGWQKRVVVIRSDGTRGNSGLCLEPHDLAASKLVAFRDKDRDFVRLLLTERMINAKVLISRIQTLDVSAEQRQRMTEWVLLTVAPPSSD
jgi:hypothetical protein